MKLSIATLYLFSVPGPLMVRTSPLPPGTTVPGDTESASARCRDTRVSWRMRKRRLLRRTWMGRVGRFLIPTWRSIQRMPGRSSISDMSKTQAIILSRPRGGVYRKAIEANPKQFEAQLAMGLLLAQQGKTDQALPYIEAATLLDPAPPES